jgi:hypothetical protein
VQRDRGHLPRQRAEERPARHRARRSGAPLAAQATRRRAVYRRARAVRSNCPTAAASVSSSSRSHGTACSTVSTSSATCCNTPTRSHTTNSNRRRRHESAHRYPARRRRRPGSHRAAVAVLKAVAERSGHTFRIRSSMPSAAAAIDATGEPLPPPTLEACKKADAVLLGAVGGPKWSDPNAKVRPEQGLLALRAALGVYANLRPLQVHPALAPVAAEKREAEERRRAVRARTHRRRLLRCQDAHGRHRHRRMQVHRRRSRARGAPRVRIGARPPSTRHLGGQGQRAGNFAPVAQHRAAHRCRLSGRQARASAGRFDGDAAADAAVALRRRGDREPVRRHPHRRSRRAGRFARFAAIRVAG